MRPEVGFADLVRAIDRLRVRRPDDVHAIANLIVPGLDAGVARKPSPTAPDAARAREPAPSAPQRPPPRGQRASRRPATEATQDRDAEAVTKRDLPARAHTSAAAARAAPISLAGGTGAAVLEARAAPERLVLEPMIEPMLARAIIAALLGRPVFEGPIDLASAVAVIAAGRPLRRVPRRRRCTLRFAAQLLIDTGPGMLPFSGDLADLERRVKGVVGAERVDVVRFRGSAAPSAGSAGSLAGEHLDASSVQRAGRWVPYNCPAPLTPVLALTDFGLAHGGMTARDSQSWRDLAAILARTGSPLVVLTPCPPTWWPRALDGAAVMVQWDRATARVRRGARTPDAHEAREPARPPDSDVDFGWFAAAHPQSYALARLVALTARCEPALVRRLRRRFLPAAEAWIEGELWASPLVEVRAVSGLRLRADATRALLDSWRGDPQLADAAATIEAAHTGASLVVRVQERLTAQVMQPDAHAQSEVRRLLARVAATLSHASGASPLRSWAQYTLSRLPEARLAEIPAAVHLAVAAAPPGQALIGSGVHAAQLLRVADIDEAAPDSIDYDVRSQLSADAPRRPIQVRRERQTAVFELVERAAGGVELLVPDTRPVLLEVLSGDSEPVVITLDAGEVRVPWSDGPLVIYAIDGTGWELRPIGTTRAPIDAPWSSLARLVTSRELAFGYLLEKRLVVAAAASVDPESIEPVKIALGDVLLHAVLATVDSALGVALLQLDGDAPVEPLDGALRGVPDPPGADLYAAMVHDASPKLVSAKPARLPPELAAHAGALRLTDGHPGMPVIAGGRVMGVLAAPLAYDTRGGTQLWTVAPRDAIARLRVRHSADKAALEWVAQQIGVASEIRWADLAVAAEPVLRDVALAHGYVDSLARQSERLRSAAVLWWMHHPSPVAVPHVLELVVESRRAIDRAIAIYALEQLVAHGDVSARQARTARRLLARLPRSALVGALAARAGVLDDALARIEGPRERSNLPAPSVLPRFVDRRGVERLAASLRGDVRVLVLTGGIDGELRRAVASWLHRRQLADVAISWTFQHSADGNELTQAMSELMQFPADAGLDDFVRAASDADASVLLDRFDRVADTREQALRALCDLVEAFAPARRGRLIVTWSGSLPALPPREGMQCVALQSLALVVPFREHLLSALESPRLLGRWLAELVSWGPIAAVAAVARAVSETLPRAWAGEQPALAELKVALRAWFDHPSSEAANAFRAVVRRIPTELERPPLSLLSIGEALFAMMCAVDIEPAIPRISRTMLRIAPMLSYAALPTLQAVIRRAYMGTTYLRDDATELVIAFDEAIGARARTIEYRLRALTAGDVEPAGGRDDPDKLTFRASPSVYRQLSAQWRAGALSELAGAQIRWLAERNPFPIQDDPQKGHWGGLPERNGRLVSAAVTRQEATDWYDVRIEVAARPGEPALRGPVRAYLHDSFVKSVVDLPLYQGRAVLKLIAWGAFTIGIECDGGSTHLELDLANVRNVDPEFIDDDPTSEPGLEVASYGVDLPLASGTRWIYTSKVGGRYHVRVVERVEHAGGVVAVRLESTFDHAVPPAVPAVWLLTRGDGRYYAVPDDPRSPMVRLRARSDDLRDVMVTENLFLRLRARPRTSFANAFCVVNVVDVRFDVVSGRGYRRKAVIYDVEQIWPSGTANLSIVPGVGVIHATDREGNKFELAELSEGRQLSMDAAARSKAVTVPATKAAQAKKAAASKPPLKKAPAKKARAKKSAAKKARGARRAAKKK